MKKIILGALLSTIVGAAFAGNADFTLVNRTGYAINEVFISPSKQSNWGKDRLGENQFMNGQARKFKFGDTKNCKQDIQVVFTDGDEVEWEDINLCEVNKVILKYNKKTGDVSAELE
ncbi:MAG: hypothetical protein RR311_17265 [Comamonas sp.]